MSQMNVQIVTPDGLVYDHHAAFVSVKTIDGELGILPHHINTIAVLAVDQVKVRRVDDDKHIDWIAVNGGIIEVADNVITIVADSAERARDIDINPVNSSLKGNFCTTLHINRMLIFGFFKGLFRTQFCTLSPANINVSGAFS